MDANNTPDSLVDSIEKSPLLINEISKSNVKSGYGTQDPIPGPSNADIETQQNSIETQSEKEQLENDNSKTVEEVGNAEDEFVVIEPDGIFDYQKHIDSFFAQIEAYLALQIVKCDYYKRYFEQQNNVTMATRFETYSVNTASHLNLIKNDWPNKKILPSHKFERINFNCLPVNVDVKERELQLVVTTSDLSVSEGANTYIIAEFAFSNPKDETLINSFARKLHCIKIDPKNILCCSSGDPRQLDIIYSTERVPFYNPKNKSTEYDRPISFFVDKGKSRSLKRKFKPVKLTFYEKIGFFSYDKKLGSVQVKIDAINDLVTYVTRSPIMDGRKQTAAVAVIRVKVREPLVEKSLRAHEEKLLVLT